MTYDFERLMRDLEYADLIICQLLAIKKKLRGLPFGEQVNVERSKVICGCGVIYELKNDRFCCKICGNFIEIERRSKTVSLYESYDSVVPYGFSSESYCVFKSTKLAVIITGLRTIVEGSAVWIDTSNAEDYNDKVELRRKLVQELEKYEDELKNDSSCKRVYKVLDKLYENRDTGVGKWTQIGGLLIRVSYKDNCWQFQYDVSDSSDIEEAERIVKMIADVFKDDAKLQGFAIEVKVERGKRKEYEPIVEVSL